VLYVIDMLGSFAYYYLALARFMPGSFTDQERFTMHQRSTSPSIRAALWDGNGQRHLGQLVDEYVDHLQQ
jgi:hypothetical protein